ncbi:hypothetical protein MQE23_08595 [Streptomyces sp. HP-A2021]|uniref:hypothetical protein n=1 Tax=Streptomyces sp. HP-A2021 TaxID=2927875 RepID=UPI001FAECF25|nr:hypothetical protein [Streptomyces sp. HP-A2021]UOB09110.1 hypothetical protein MQE23_08595 [Streptomyces sp. HP-A2021]
MPDELTVRKLIQYVPACDSGRHVHHPQETCDEYEEFSAHVRAYFQRIFAEAYAEADRLLITGNGTGEPRGLADWEPKEPTPIERALAILEPELRRCPMYKAGPPALPLPVTRRRQSARTA